jgi:hypothetical protein
MDRTLGAPLDKIRPIEGVKVSDAQFSAVNLSRHTFHGDWNYTIEPRAVRPPR